MLPALRLACKSVPDLEATMRLQLAGLAWNVAEEGGWQRTFHLHGRGILVRVDADLDGLRFYYQTAVEERPLHTRLTAMFRNGYQVGAMDLDGHPALRALRREHRGMVLLNGAPFEILVLALLAQGNANAAVRTAFPRLLAGCGALTPRRLAAVPLPRLAQLLTPISRIKAARLHATATIIARRGEAAFDLLVRRPGLQALTYLVSLPGVGTYTAAAVMTITSEAPHTVPADEHLMRIAYRLGLTDHDGNRTIPGSRQVAADLLAYGTCVARVYPLLRQVATDTCTVGDPSCEDCFLAEHCRHAAKTGVTDHRTV
jgi:endonuclease III